MKNTNKEVATGRILVEAGGHVAVEVTTSDGQYRIAFDDAGASFEGRLGVCTIRNGSMTFTRRQRGP